MIAFGEALPGDLPTDVERIAAAESEMRNSAANSCECPLDTLVLEGTAWDVICDTAQRREIDLIVIASHGYTGLKRILLGSTAERVVRHAHTPVLVVKSYPEEAKTVSGRSEAQLDRAHSAASRNQSR